MSFTSEVFVENYKLDVCVGIHAYERQCTQKIICSIYINYDCASAAKSDDINDALDYEQLMNTIAAKVKPTKFLLVEKLAAFMLDIIKNFCPKYQKITLVIHKPNLLPGDANCGVRYCVQR